MHSTVWCMLCVNVCLLSVHDTYSCWQVILTVIINVCTLSVVFCPIYTRLAPVSYISGVKFHHKYQ